MLMKANQDMKIISKLIKTAAGRADLGTSMVEPLRSFQDYSSVLRRAFLVDQLADGSIPYYDKDVEMKAYVVSEEGEDVTEVISRDSRVFVPLFEIAANPQIPWSQIKQRRYDVQTRVQEVARAEIFCAEDQKLVSLLDKASTGFHSVISVTGAQNLKIEHFSSAIGQLESVGRGLNCANIFMNPIHNQVIRTFNKDYFSIDFNTSAEIVNSGRLGTLYGAEIHTSSEIPKDKIYFTCQPEYLGRLVESIPLMVIPADDNVKRTIGWSVFEQIGALVNNPKGICAISIS